MGYVARPETLLTHEYGCRGSQPVNYENAKTHAGSLRLLKMRAKDVQTSGAILWCSLVSDVDWCYNGFGVFSCRVTLLACGSGPAEIIFLLVLTLVY